MVGSIVMFVPKDDKVFPYNLNGAKELPAIVIQDFGGYQNLGVVTPFDGIKAALSVKQGTHGYETESYWYKKQCDCGADKIRCAGGVADMIGGLTQEQPFVVGPVESYPIPDVLGGPEVEPEFKKEKESKTKYPIQKNKKSTKKSR